MKNRSATTLQELLNFASHHQKIREENYGKWPGTCADCCYWQDLNDGFGPGCLDGMGWDGDSPPAQPICLIPRASNDEYFDGAPHLQIV